MASPLYPIVHTISENCLWLYCQLPDTHSGIQSFLYSGLNLPFENCLIILINSVSPLSSGLSSLYFYNLHVFVYTFLFA